MDARAIRLRELVDVVFSNAALHWVDDHRRVVEGAAAILKPGGRFVVSCGGRGNAQDVFRILRSVMREPQWRDHFQAMPRPYFFYSPSEYALWLEHAGLRPVRLALVPKYMLLDGADGLAAWLRTTWLPYTQRVPEPLRAQFVRQTTNRYVKAHPLDEAGRVRIRMIRLEIHAHRN
jgi:trans-aconitate methyltransferase